MSGYYSGMFEFGIFHFVGGGAGFFSNKGPSVALKMTFHSWKRELEDGMFELRPSFCKVNG